MKNDDEQNSLMLVVIGIIPVIWFALLVAPYLSSGLMGILEGVPGAMNHPFSIQLCGDSVKTVLNFFAVLRHGNQDLYFYQETLPTRRRTWLCQMGKCEKNQSQIQGEAIYKK